MIRLTRGNLLEADVEALVNAVNTVGVMGKGIALQFKRAFPEVFGPYQAACKRGELDVGQVLTVELPRLGRPTRSRRRFSPAARTSASTARPTPCRAARG